MPSWTPASSTASTARANALHGPLVLWTEVLMEGFGRCSFDGAQLLVDAGPFVDPFVDGSVAVVAFRLRACATFCVVVPAADVGRGEQWVDRMQQRCGVGFGLGETRLLFSLRCAGRVRWRCVRPGTRPTRATLRYCAVVTRAALRRAMVLNSRTRLSSCRVHASICVRLTRRVMVVAVSFGSVVGIGSSSCVCRWMSCSRLSGAVDRFLLCGVPGCSDALLDDHGSFVCRSVAVLRCWRCARFSSTPFPG